MSQKRTDFAFPRSLSTRKPALSLPNGHALSLPNGRGAGTQERAGITVLGAPSNLKQTHFVNPS